MPSELDKVERFETETRGRGLRAKNAFKPGKVILKADPFAYVIRDEMAPQVCQYTLNLAMAKEAGSQAPIYQKCSRCKWARYESRAAQKADWKDHKDECAATCRVAPKRFNDETRLVAKMLSKLKRLNGKASPEESLITISDMQDHMENRTPEDRPTLDENVMNFGDYYGYENLPDDEDKTLYHLFGILECNGFSINDSRGITVVGVGVYPSISLLNHSFDPNCVAISIGKQVHLRALKEIEEGEELFINYIGEMIPLDEGIKQLKETFYFDYDINTEPEGLKEQILERDSKLNAYLDTDEHKVTDQQKTYIRKYSTDMFKRIEKTRAGGNHPRYTLQATGALMQQENVLADTHHLKLRMLRYAIDGLAAQKCFVEAKDYAVTVLAAYKEMLPKHSSSLGMYNLKVGTFYWHLQEIDLAIKTLADAAHGLEITHGETHNMYQDCLQMIMQCQQESKLDKFSRAKIRAAREQMGKNVAIDIDEALKDKEDV